MSADVPASPARRGRFLAAGAQPYRSLDELADSPEFQAYLQREFPANATEWLDPVGRRTFVKLMGASMALAGVSACTAQPAELIVPYVRQPEEEIPGKPLFFATTMTLGGMGMGLLVESQEGRPTKVEGNPEHPGSLGATDLYAQASVLTLYDPDRSPSILQLGEIRPWSAFISAVRAGLSAQTETGGAGLRILTETVSSPTLAAQIQAVLAAFPGARWIQWEPTTRDNARLGARQAFGQFVQPAYDLSRANVILSLDADFLSSEGADNVVAMRQFATRRRPENAAGMSRLYVVEPAMTVTGAKADQRLPMKAADIEAFARAVAARVGVGGGAAAPAGSDTYVEAIAADLAAHRGASVVVAGEAQPSAVHALAHAINQALGNAGSTVTYLPTPEAVPSDQNGSLRELVTDMEAGRVQMLMVLGESNPVQTAPVDLRFGDALNKVPLRIHSALFFDETATFCHWHVPATHYLEAWSDARTVDGTASLVQPLVQPLYGGKSAHEIVATLSDRPERSGYDLVREYWQGQPAGLAAAGGAPPNPARPNENTPVVGAPNVPSAQGQGPAAAPARPVSPAPGATEAARVGTPSEGGVTSAGPGGGTVGAGQQPGATNTPTAGASTFDRAWRQWLHDGFIPGTAYAPRTVSVSAGAVPATSAAGTATGPFEVNFRRDPTIYDGRYANNGWLQELPKPISKLVWDNAAMIAPATAERLELSDGDLVEIRHEGRLLRIPVWLSPGHVADSVTVHLGYGRTRAGRVGNGTGFNAWALRGSGSPWFGGAEVAKNGDSYDLVSTQNHWAIEGRNVVRSAHLEEYRKNPRFVAGMEHISLEEPLNLYPEYRYEGYRWGMAIDMNTCTGCTACVVACQAENNIPVVGKAQVKVNREMHWLRVDRYFAGDLDNPDTYVQPIPCMHCEKAPCEVVCPVAATVHDDEGLNVMIYNRCVGTRYCSNNCPYKVRRFNFHLYQDWNTPTYKLQRNPDVSVRSRGVMEKCTYCIQRISAARIQAKREDREIVDGEVQTACQAVCPADAIVFGDINDRNSRVVALKNSPRNYGMLEELNTQPRTTYLAAVRNPNPALPTNPSVGSAHGNPSTDAHQQGEQH